MIERERRRRATGYVSARRGLLGFGVTVLLGALVFTGSNTSAWARGHGGGGHSGSHGSGRSFSGHGGGYHRYRGHVGYGVFFGFPGWWGYYPYDYLYGYPASVSLTPPPGTTYIQRPDLEELESESPHWYYCYDPPGYYPSVPECNGTWTPVAPLTTQSSSETSTDSISLPH